MCSQRGQEAWAARQAERLGGLEVDQQLKTRGLLHRQIGWLRPFENFVYVHGGRRAMSPTFGP